MDEECWFEDLLASGHVLGVSAIARKQLNEDIGQMPALAAANVETSFLAFEHRDEDGLKQIQKREEEIDLYNARLSRRISRVLAMENSPSEVSVLNCMLPVIGNVERIGDYIANTTGYARATMERGSELSSQVSVEPADTRTLCMGAVRLTCSTCIAESKPRSGQDSLLEQALFLEQDIDRRTAWYRSNQIKCIGKGKCYVETPTPYSEILTDHEHIGDHAFNIAQVPDKPNEN